MKTVMVVVSLIIGGFVALALPALADSLNSHDVVRDKRGTVVSSEGGCVRSTWIDGSDVCAPPAPPKPVVVQAPPPPVRTLVKEERTLYFGFDKAELATEAHAKLDNMARVLIADAQVRQALIVGYADRMGQTSYNEALSKKRAEAVRDYLAGRGYVKTSLADTRWLGESAPRAECPTKLTRAQMIECLQPDRRVEVEIEYITTVPAPRAPVLSPNP